MDDRDSVEELIAASQTYGHSRNTRQDDMSLYDDEDENGAPDDGMFAAEDFESLYGGGGGEDGGVGAFGEDGEEEESEEGGLMVARNHSSHKNSSNMDEAEESDGEDIDNSGDMEDDDDTAGLDPQAKVIAAMKTAKEAFNSLKAVSRSGNILGTYISLQPVDFDRAYSALCPDEKNPAPAKPASKKKRNYSQMYDESFEAGSDASDASVSSDENGSSAGRTSSDRTSDDDDGSCDDGDGGNDSGEILNLLKNYNIKINDNIQGALDAINKTGHDHNKRATTDGERRKKRRRKNNSNNNKGELTTEQIDAFVKEKFADDINSAGLTFEDFTRITCPLCAFGNQAGDPIYAPKLQFVKTIANEGIMRGHLETTIMMVVLFWNRYIVVPMVKRGRRIMRLTYAMAMNHLTEPHIPDPRIDVRLDIHILNRMAKAARNSIFHHNSFTGNYQYDSKAFKDAAMAIRTKHAIRKNRLETQAFFSPNMDFGEQTAGSFTNPYMQVHWGAKEPPRSQTAAQKPQGNRSAGKWRGWRNDKN